MRRIYRGELRRVIATWSVKAVTTGSGEGEEDEAEPWDA
ncbi:hypothetical protein AZE42_01724 [Rhizopogon vesiculosus]|uniref:Uncharacterized protein n=1 Tax=Rhizopogon vesiculosus TaxID=180088 RepID=A0A1J8QA80_9AGAM|nr:hypothetical protein AZE42_01724 [Rhizopogon vesiculosus]